MHYDIRDGGFIFDSNLVNLIFTHCHQFTCKSSYLISKFNLSERDLSMEDFRNENIYLQILLENEKRDHMKRLWQSQYNAPKIATLVWCATSAEFFEHIYALEVDRNMNNGYNEKIKHLHFL